MTITASNVIIKQKIPFNELKIEKEIGSGNYGKVYLGKWKEIPVALKFCEVEGNADEFLSEINIQMYFDFRLNFLFFLFVRFD
jgi:predicted Ser/Thr protein kinase